VKQSQTVAPLYGLVLSGGRSSRMQRDKATLAYHGTSQLEWAVQNLKPHVEKVFVSVRPDQQQDPVRAAFPQIVDTREDLGPSAGIMAAQERYPEAAWLILACDLPFLDKGTLAHLVKHRDPQKVATAYRSTHDGLPEPLCAIWEPASREPLLRQVATGRVCPRKFLLGNEPLLLDQPAPRALDNVNTPEEYGSAVSALKLRADKQIRVQYFALLREQAGRSDETLSTSAATPRELYLELQSRYPFSLAVEMLRVAVNAEFGEWTRPLADGDSVVFIPPVAGG
jgi:molybdenum cofactor guanylyltransferase